METTKGRNQSLQTLFKAEELPREHPKVKWNSLLCYLGGGSDKAIRSHSTASVKRIMRNHNLWFLVRIAIRRWMIKAIIKRMKYLKGGS